ncbi:serine hydrolase [Winogradskyella eckloniae]|uniref:serine hydrolase domain-containing protein n=1 Tax=Winogradskyella eckloniae TaxID=1089306 RepID=UPI001565FDE7|nr:serine hydrolase [Winogradskyella eckloniae]NRD20597.1 serine hydrolase [Winogradskyella eckloniae]
MKSYQFTSILLLFLVFLSCSDDDSSSDDVDPQLEDIYFPPNNSDTWETKTISELNWNEDQLQPLLDFLEEKNTKSFIILHNGKIVVEEYMNGHNSNTTWYWASAGKTLTTAISGIAEQEGFIDINNKVSDYVGTGWTSAPAEKEDLITCQHLLSMTSGLDDEAGDDISPENLQYVADAGTRWAYHNVFVKMQDVVEEATNETWDNYFTNKLKNPIGMNGSWTTLGNINVYWSNTRSMARFGLLTYANGSWEDTQILNENFVVEATNTSQDINLAYGYLWWLNGKSTYHLPQSQVEFPGELIPDAPSDTFTALGLNDQKIYIVPSKELVVIRMGQAADSENFALSSFDNDLWVKINTLIN